jgi:TP901 family phage tail tape measure protein
MASAFNLTAQINLRGPTNLKPIVAEIKRELGSFTSNVNIKLDNRSAKSIDSVSNRLKAMNDILIKSNAHAKELSNTFSALSASLGNIQRSSSSAGAGVGKVSSNMQQTAKNIKIARTEIEEFGRQSALAVRRFAAFSVVTSAVFGLTNAITSGFKAFIDFDRELVKLQQVTGKGAIGIKSLEQEITRLATTLGVSSESLMSVASTLAQAGLTADETRTALAALAKTELAPSFDNLTDTTEGAIAAMRQFGLQAQDLEAALGSINAVAAAFAVESKDIITAIQRTGGVFAAASKGVTEGKDALNEFVAVFTSVRATTRESAETIATGLRTIFTRIQRADTIQQLKQFGVNLQDLEGKFVGPYEAVKRLSEALNKLDPRDVRFATIVEELGGFRQIGKVIPLIQQFATAQQALGVAQKGQGSLTDAQVKAQQSLANQIAKVREQFLALIRDIGQSTVFQGLFKIVLGLTSGFLSLASAFKPILPILAVFTAIKGASAIGQFATGFFGGLKKGGGAGGAGQNIGENLSGAKEKQRSEATAKAADAIRLNTDALQKLTSAVQTLTSKIGSSGKALNAGGKVMGFARGGVVPGSGNRDTVPAMLMPGEFVIRKKAVEKLGAGNLQEMNKYAAGGPVKATKLKSRAIQNRIKSANSKIDEKEFKSGKYITDSDTFTFEKREFGLQSPKNIGFKKFEENVGKKIGGTPVGGNAPVDIPDNNFGFPIEVRNRNQTTKDNVLLDKLLRYNLDQSGGNKLIENQKTQDRNKFVGTIGIAYNTSKVNRSRFEQLNKGGKLGARSKFKELSPEEIGKLSTKDLIQYGKDLAYDIFSTGGAGMATGHEFIEVPKERIIPELDQYLTSYLGKRGFWQEKVAPFGKPTKASTKTTAKQDRAIALQNQVNKQADEVAAREQQWTSIRDGSEIDNYLLSTLTDPILSDYKSVRKGGKLDKAFHSTRLRQAVNKALESYDNFDYSAANIDKLVSGMAAERFAAGGFVQNFMAGGTTSTAGSISQEILDRIKALGGPGSVKDLAAKEVLEAVKASGAGSSGKLLDSRSLKANPNSAQFAPYLEKVLDAAESAKKGKESAARKQLENNMRAATGAAYQFGLVSLFGPNGELGYSSTSDAKELTGKNGEKFLTQIVRKSLPERYAEAIKATQADIAGVASRGAERFQYSDIFGVEGPLAFDFDDTLVKGADIYAPNGGIDIKAYNDLEKVKEALADAQLTLLGKELSKRVADYPQLLDSIRILTARPQSNAPLLADKLSQLGLPISSSKITGVSGGLNKVNNLSDLETLIDDNLENIQSVLGGGKKGYLYNEPRDIDTNDASSRKSMANMEGYALEEIVKSLGVRISADDDSPNRPIDYPQGLGVAASKWNIKSTIPTDTKRTNDSSALSRIWGEAQRYFVEKFAFGGKADGEPSEFEKTKQQILDKYPDINFRISKRKRGFGYNILGGLKKEGDNTGNYADFQQASNLKQLSELADKIAYSLQYQYGPDIDSSLLKKTQKFAGGGTVSAMVSSGEAYVSPKLAKKIGYAKLDKMNQADRNGMKGFAGGGGIGLFSGPGSGTSDSIGPISLPVGSYVIREKASKALGLYKNGGTIKRFAEGGRPSKAERKRMKEAYLAEQRGGITREEARAVGMPRPDYGAGASRKRDVMARPQGEMNIAKIEAEVIANYRALYKEEKKKIDELYAERENAILEQAAAGTISTGEAFDQTVELSREKDRAKAAAKDKLTTESQAATKKATEEYTQGKQTTQIGERKAAATEAFDTEMKSAMANVAKEVKAKYQQLYDEERKSLKDFYDERYKQVQAEGGDVGAVLAEYKGAVADAKQAMEAGLKTETAERQAALPEQIAAQKKAQVEEVRSAKDPFYEAKKAAEATASGSDSPFNFTSSPAANLIKNF